jgi:hypothetical protein
MEVFMDQNLIGITEMAEKLWYIFQTALTFFREKTSFVS